jgi:pSer/pThr/pTyr-binding forkhead associated (FHA) protein
VRDDGLSRNGTFVNDERVNGKRRMRDGDQLRVGHTVLVFRSPTPAPASHPRARGAGRGASPQRRVLFTSAGYVSADGFAPGHQRGHRRRPT